MEIGVLVPCYVGPSRVDCMPNEGVCMHPSKMILAYCDESLSDIQKSQGFMY